MPIRGRRESSGGNRRAVLLLSLILLVWNAGAEAVRLLPIGRPRPIDRTGGFPALPSVPFDRTDVVPFESPRAGPLTIRQKYLLGKRIDINQASRRDLSELPGISDDIAAAVVRERERLGRFRSPADLLGVRGIKGKRLQKILPFLAEMQNN